MARDLPSSAAYAAGFNLLLLGALAILGVQSGIDFAEAVGILVAANGAVLLIALLMHQRRFAGGWAAGLGVVVGGLALMVVVSYGLCSALLRGA